MRKKLMNHSTRKTTVSKLKKETLYAQISPKQPQLPQRYKFPQRLTMKLMKKSNHDSLTISKWNYEKKQILTVSDITTTVAPLTHRWQCQGKTNYHLHFWILNLKEFFMNPASYSSSKSQYEDKWLKAWICFFFLS